jgi:hypothetical protein
VPAGDAAHVERLGEPTRSAPDLTARSTCPDASASPHAELGRLSGVLGGPVHDPMDLSAAEAAPSPRPVAATSGVPITVPSEEPA